MSDELFNSEKYELDDREHLQKRIKPLRILCGWSSERLGNILGVSRKTMTTIENCKRPISRMEYYALLGVFDEYFSKCHDFHYINSYWEGKYYRTYYCYLLDRHSAPIRGEILAKMIIEWSNEYPRKLGAKKRGEAIRLRLLEAGV